MTGAEALDETWRRVHAAMPEARRWLSELVAFPSVADGDPAHGAACEAAAAWTRDAFAAAGLDVGLEPTVDGSVAVVGGVEVDPAAPTVLLYAHYDVQPAGDPTRWDSDPWQLTERDGRWYGRGAADCKGGIVTHLAALRVFERAFPCNLKVAIEGSEEQGTAGLEQLLRARPELAAADAVIVLDSGNVAPGVPTITTTLRGTVAAIVSVDTLASGQHSGTAGGPAPDALLALVKMLATLRDERGNTTIAGLPVGGSWHGSPYDVERFRRDVGVLDGVDLVGDGDVAEMLWARPAVTVTGIDAPPARGSGNEIQPSARARVNLRIPAGIAPAAAEEALVTHLLAAAPWRARVAIELESSGAGLDLPEGGRALEILCEALESAFDHRVVRAGQGGSIPLCAALAELQSGAEILLIGIDEPGSAIHAANENVRPMEIEHVAVAEALFLDRYGRSFEASAGAAR